MLPINRLFYFESISNYTDGKASLKDYLEAAIKREYTYVC